MATSRRKATTERWTYKIAVNDGKTRVESSGYIEPLLGDALRVLQIHITRLSNDERHDFRTLAARVLERMEKGR